MGSFFDKTSLRELGLRVQLGHDNGSTCLKPCRGPDEMIVIHTNSIHEVAVNYCDCYLRVPPRRQLLRFGWYPATVHRPNTCSTIESLELFHSLTLTSKLSAYDYYKAQTYLTDTTGLLIAKVCSLLSFQRHNLTSYQSCYKSFLRMVRQWRHLLMLLQGGKGCEENGAYNVEPGALAMQCPACPNPETNLPEGWNKAPPKIR